MSSILSHFPGFPRKVQAEALKQIEEKWDHYDVFVVQVPTAGGKTKLARTIAKWANNASVIVPNNVLLDQYTNEAEEASALYKRDFYWCETYKRSCEETHRKLGRCCKDGCKYTASLKKAKVSPIVVCNYYTYLAHKMYRNVLIVDEAHMLMKLLQDLATKRIWKHEYGWPTTIRSMGDISEWLESLAKLDTKLTKLQTELNSLKPSTLVRRTAEYWRGELREMLKLIPLDTKKEPPRMWPPNKVRKIVLMSATIESPDIDSMGLGNKRVTYIRCPSPIPIKNRPIIYHPVGNLSFKHQDASIVPLASFIKEKLEENPDKGMLHLPYSLAQKLYPLLKDEDRLVWHTRDNKREQLDFFLDSDPEDGAVLVGSGLYEGIDLVDDLGRWQIVTKVPYQSLADPAIRAKLAESEDWYAWQAIRDVLQASGRICRTESDFGVTFIVDSMFENLYKHHKELFPDWWTSALMYEGK